MARTRKPGEHVEDMRLQALNQVNLVTRSALAAYLGYSYDGNRNLYTALGYIADNELSYNHYLARYLRQDLAQRLIDAPVNAAWRGKPSIVDGTGEKGDREDTAFEKAWKQLVGGRIRVLSILQDLDRFTGLGQYGVLVFGFEGDSRLSDPVVKKEGKKLAYLRAYGEGSVTISRTNTNTNSMDYGMPEMYSITPKVANQTETAVQKNVPVHASRVIHVVDGLTESRIYGIPRLKSVFNRLMDLEKVAGGSAEMYWRNAKPGLHMNMDADAMMTPETKEALKTQLDEYENGLRRILRTQGMDLNQLAPELIDPEKFIDIQISLISGAKAIPKRILTGTERGELASTQDAHNWNTTVQERRTDFCEPFILRPFVDKLIDVGVLPEPDDDDNMYSVEWPDLFAPSDKQQAEVAKMRAEALMMYSNSLTGEQVLPAEAFLELIMGFTGSKLKKVLDAVKEQEKKNQEEFDEDEEILRRALEQPGGTPAPQPQPGEGE